MKLPSRVGVFLSAVVTVLGLGTVVAAPAAYASSTGPFQVINSNSGLCMDVKGAWTASGTPIQQYTCNQSVAQYWLFQADWSGGKFKMEPVNALSTPGCLTNHGWSSTSGAAVDLEACSPAPWVASSQSYSLIPGHDAISPFPTPGTQYRYRFINDFSQMCLQPSGGSRAVQARIVQATCNGSAAQDWIVDF